MRGIEAIYGRGVTAWPGGPKVEFTQAQIKRVGKVYTYCDFVTRYVVELTDGRMVFVVLSKLPADDAAFMRKVGKTIVTAGYPTRDLPQLIFWKEIQ